MKKHESTSTAKCPFAKIPGPAAASLADILREQTKEAHSRAEKHPAQGRLVRGEATRDDYAAWLGQLLHVWKALDGGLASAAAIDPRIAGMLKPYHPHAARVAADLSFLGFGGKSPALPGTAKFVSEIYAAAGNGPALVGVWYVLEGSANGGRYIAKALSRSLNLTGPEGLTSLDPHGELQRERWQVWRADLDKQPWTAAERKEIVAAAGAAFDAIYGVLEDLNATSPLTV